MCDDTIPTPLSNASCPGGAKQERRDQKNAVRYASRSTSRRVIDMTTCQGALGKLEYMEVDGQWNDTRVVATVSGSSIKQCSRCNGMGTEMRQKRLVPCAARKLQQRAERYTRAGVPGHLCGEDLRTLRDNGNIHVIRKMLYRHLSGWRFGDRGLWFSGSYGTGKSHLCSAIVKELVTIYDAKVLWIDFSHITDILAENLRLLCQTRVTDRLQSMGGGVDDVLTSHMRGYNVFVFDDVSLPFYGVEHATAMRAMIDYAYMNGLTSYASSIHPPFNLFSMEEFAGSPSRNLFTGVRIRAAPYKLERDAFEVIKDNTEPINGVQTVTGKASQDSN